MSVVLKGVAVDDLTVDRLTSIEKQVDLQRRIMLHKVTTPRFAYFSLFYA